MLHTPLKYQYIQTFEQPQSGMHTSFDQLEFHTKIWRDFVFNFLKLMDRKQHDSLLKYFSTVAVAVCSQLHFSTINFVISFGNASHLCVFVNFNQSTLSPTRPLWIGQFGEHLSSCAFNTNIQTFTIP